jgi:hypothetical protein
MNSLLMRSVRRLIPIRLFTKRFQNNNLNCCFQKQISNNRLFNTSAFARSFNDQKDISNL